MRLTELLESRRRQVTRRLLGAAAIDLVALALLGSVFPWPAPAVAVVCGLGRIGLAWRARPSLDALAARADTVPTEPDLVRTGLAVERGLATGAADLQASVAARAIEAARSQGGGDLPRVRLPVVLPLLAGLALLLRSTVPDPTPPTAAIGIAHEPSADPVPAPEGRLASFARALGLAPQGSGSKAGGRADRPGTAGDATTAGGAAGPDPGPTGVGTASETEALAEAEGPTAPAPIEPPRVDSAVQMLASRAPTGGANEAGGPMQGGNSDQQGPGQDPDGPTNPDQQGELSPGGAGSLPPTSKSQEQGATPDGSGGGPPQEGLSRPTEKKGKGGAQGQQGPPDAPTPELGDEVASSEEESSTGPGARGGADAGGTDETEAPLVGLPPVEVARQWVDAQWKADGAGLLREVGEAALGQTSDVGFGQLREHYEALAEGAMKEGDLPPSRQAYVRAYFDAISTEPPLEPTD